jgi:mRNA-degrading endonuclease YafQ of YafQ-DinJ toxin-antitoxin module
LGTNIVIPDTILKRLNDLPKEVRIKFWEQLERLTTNPSYPRLRNEKLKGIDVWAFSITMNCRAIYIRSKMRIIITAIGSHKEVLGD